MGTIISKAFADREKLNQLRMLCIDPFITQPVMDGARCGGYTILNNKKVFLPYILIPEDSIKNLYAPIRDEALKYFEKYNISWWRDKEDRYFPTGQLISSQNHCLNHLFALRKKPDEVLMIINSLSSIKFAQVLPSPIDHKEEKEAGPNFISFEFTWRNTDLLKERANTRGENCTSIDAIVYAKAVDGKKYLIPIEWKYTEKYEGKDIVKKETVDKRYAKLVGNTSNIPAWIDMYNSDPGFEFARQELLIEQIIHNPNIDKKNNLEVDDFLHVIVCPDDHTELKQFVEEFRKTLTQPGKLISISPKKIISVLSKSNDIDIKNLITYLKFRYKGTYATECLNKL